MMNTKRLVEAFQYAAELHKDQLRKGTSIPYISHLMAVAGIVLEHGGDEDQVIAALLHDAIEDHPENDLTRKEIQEGFGDRVLALVEDCTDSNTNPKPPWRKRKEDYLKRLLKAPREAKLISLADKVHNARAIVSDFLQIGDEIWKRFKGSKDGTLWYYRSLAEIFTQEHPGPLAEELERVVGEMERMAGPA
jgi:(p)ppGpp synthase/HD superfamily hydrolase